MAQHKSHRPKRTSLPEYATCTTCGEFFWSALSVQPDGRVLCLNCADARHFRGQCCVCERIGPLEYHHVASRRQRSDLTEPVCLNCHAVLTERMCRDWHPAWRTLPADEATARVFEQQGRYDIFLLEATRSPLAACVFDTAAVEEAVRAALSAPRDQVGWAAVLTWLGPLLIVLGALVWWGLCGRPGWPFGADNRRRHERARDDGQAALDPPVLLDWPELDRWL
jgi:hypothetical protein